MSKTDGVTKHVHTEEAYYFACLLLGMLKSQMLKYHLTVLESVLQPPSDVNVKCYVEFTKFDKNPGEDESPQAGADEDPVRTQRLALIRSLMWIGLRKARMNLLILLSMISLVKMGMLMCLVIARMKMLGRTSYLIRTLIIQARLQRSGNGFIYKLATSMHRESW
jgi:hypothetical protein